MRGLLGSVLVALVALLAVSVMPASAKVVHPFLFSFNGSASSDPPGTPAGSFSFLGNGGVAVDNSAGPSAGDVYVMDSVHKVVDKFSVSGTTAIYDCQITGKGSANTSPPGSECDSADPGVPSGSLGFAFAQDAVDSSGVLYHGDEASHTIDEFSPTGAYVPNSQITVPTGGSPASIVLDSTGDLFVAACGLIGGCSNVVDEYNGTTWSIFASGTPTGSGGAIVPFGKVTSVAVDDDPSSPAHGDVYVVDSGNDVVDVFNAAGTYVSQLTGTTPSVPFTAVSRATVDPATGDLYVAAQADVDVFAPGGGFVSQIVLPKGANGGSAASVAVNAATGDVFVVDSNNNAVDVFGPGENIPDVTTNPAANTAQTSATLNGHVDPIGGGNVTSCEFEYVDDADYNPSASDPYSAGQTTQCSPATPYSSATDVTANVTGLAPGTTYHFRVAASNANGIVNDGSDATFTTSGPPAIDSQWAQPEPTSATLHTQINPFGLDTTCKLQYVSDTEYSNSGYATATTLPCSPSDLGSGFGDQSATVAIGGLSLDGTYHYRFIATNAAAPNGVDGPDQTFATFGVKSFSMTATDASGNPYTQAGGHPWALNTSFTLNTTPTDASIVVSPGGSPRDVHVALPPGLIGNPTAVPECTFAQLAPPAAEAPACPLDSQVGVMTVTAQRTGNVFSSPVFNMVPPPGAPAEFGSYLAGSTPATIVASVRTGSDYGIDAASLDLPVKVLVTGVSLTMWGVPADPSHNDQRCETMNGVANPVCAQPTASNAPLQPFLTMPSSCSGAQTATVSVDSYDDPGDFSTASQSLPGNTGCGNLAFTPSITVRPDTSVADSPSGLNVDLSVPQNENPDGLAEANLKDATVTLPAAVSVNPSAANGLTGCTPAEIGINNANEPACPDSSKIGTVEVDTPLLPDPLTGGIYVAQQNNNPFDSLLAIYVTAEADGTIVKLAGHVVADPVTGQLTTTFADNPQLPFTDFKLDFFGGPQAALATPESCGTFTTNSSFTPWSGTPAVTTGDAFTINSGCVSGFTPSFTAGTENPQAGAYSPFTLSFSRSDTDQNFQGLSVKLPPGMLAKLAGVQECTDAQLATAALNTGAQEQAKPSCPAASQVGIVQTGAGVGPDPYYIQGKAYLTGPYKGAPYGLAIVVPAVAGPYDLGTVVVRQALEINPTTAQVTDVSDPFPSILDGIPLRIRSVSVDLNRPNFTVNPTSCNPMAVSGTLTSNGGMLANVSSRFQVGGCQDIGFSPKLKIGLSGKGKTKSGDHPTLTATLTDRSGQANLRSAKVTLPLSMALDPNNSQHVCNYDVAAAVHGGAVGCPARTIVGTATADTPLLSKPLTGKVYLVQGFRTNNKGQRIHTLPTLLVPLRGQIALDLRAKSSVNGAGALVTTFSTIPDAPVSKFTLKITGGKKGLLVITGRGETICGKPQVASENLGAQSGKSMVNDDTLTTPCPRGSAKARKHSKRTGKAGSTTRAVRGFAAYRQRQEGTEESA